MKKLVVSALQGELSAIDKVRKLYGRGDAIYKLRKGYSLVEDNSEVRPMNIRDDVTEEEYNDMMEVVIRVMEHKTP